MSMKRKNAGDEEVLSDTEVEKIREVKKRKREERVDPSNEDVERLNATLEVRLNRRG